MSDIVARLLAELGPDIVRSGEDLTSRRFAD